MARDSGKRLVSTQSRGTSHPVQGMLTGAEMLRACSSHCRQTCKGGEIAQTPNSRRSCEKICCQISSFPSYSPQAPYRKESVCHGERLRQSTAIAKGLCDPRRGCIGRFRLQQNRDCTGRSDRELWRRISPAVYQFARWHGHWLQTGCRFDLPSPSANDSDCVYSRPVWLGSVLHCGCLRLDRGHGRCAGGWDWHDLYPRRIQPISTKNTAVQ